MMKKAILILSCFFVSVGMIYAQNITVSGTVIDEAGMEVIGASVVVKGTTTGVATDIDGKFKLNVPQNSTLVFSLVGMKKVEQKAESNMKVVLAYDDEILDEVVVTAMGITREKKALGYAAQGVKADQLVQAGNSSLSGALQGKVAGVQITPSSGMPGASSQIIIRGSRSFTGDNTPLYVIDGMPVASTSDMSTGNSVTGADFANRAVDIDPANIESVEILKGQAASALYGIRASNGVVLITTKSGKGLDKGKPQVVVNSSVSFDKISRYPREQMLYAQGTKGEFDPNASLSWGPLISELPNDPNYGGNTSNKYTQNGAELHKGRYYVPQRAKAGLDPWVAPRAYKNMRNYFDTGVTFNNSATVSQAFDKSSYSLFFGMTNQDGIVPETGMDRYTVKLTAETKLSHNWNTGFVGTYVNSNIQKAPSANTGLLATVYNAPANYDLAGIPYHAEGNPYEQVHFRGGSFENPYWGAKNNLFKEDNNRFYGNAFLNYSTKFNTTDKKLNVKYQAGVDAYTTNYMDMYAYGSNYASSGLIEEYSWSNTTFNSLLTANFQWTINEDWSLSAVAGNEVVHENTRYLYAYGSDLSFAGWNHINSANSYSASSRDRSRRTVGFFGDITASYKNMLYLGATGRYDVVSDMPRNNRSFFYPSVNASFVVTELDVFKDRKIVDFAKIRASYAEVGQAGDYRLNYFYKPTYSGGFFGMEPIKYPIGGVNSFVSYPLLYDPALKPQNTRSYELGFDLTFLNSLFDISYTYSRQNVKDQIFEVPLDVTTGSRSLLTNGGKVHTNSHEISLNVYPIRTKLVDWSFGFNWTKIDNYVDELAEGVESIFLGGFVTPQVRAGIGDKFPVIYGTTYARDKSGNIIVNDKGMPMTGKDGVIGKVSPDFLLGFNTNLRVWKLNIAAVIDWKNGGQMYHGTKGLFDFFGRGKATENREDIVFNGVKEDGTKNDVALSAQDYYDVVNSIDESSVYDNSFVKLRELSVGMTVFKKNWLEVGVNAFARNIILWSELKDFDPETSQGNTNMSGAFERFSLPQTSSYGFGVNVKF